MRAETIDATVEAWAKEPDNAKGAPVVTARADESQAVTPAGTDARGLLGVGDAAPDLGKLSLDVSIHSPDAEAGVQEIADVWQLWCPIYLALVKPTEVALHLQAS
jgi:hypothetical protein